MEQRVQLDAENKTEYLCKLRTPGNIRTAYFTRKLNIPISHNGEMFEFLKFQGKPLFSGFCSRMISFCQPLCPA